MTYGEQIRAARTAKGWSQNELARRLDVSPQAVYGWERNGRIPRRIVRIAIHRLLGVEWPADAKG